MRPTWLFFYIVLLALGAFSSVAITPASAQTYLFNRATLQVQTLPVAVAAADLNRDGAVDVLAANSGSNTVSVFRNLGNGRFSSSPLVQTGGGPAALAVAHFNGDSKPDLAVANASDNTVSVFVGNGDTTFTLVSTVKVGLHPVSIVAADFNGDHNTDLAVADQDDNTLSILLGNGDGTFTRVADVVTDPGPIVLVSGDLNRDGRPDLAVLGGTAVTPYLGNGDGTFTAQAPLSASPQPVALVIADFNGDANLDLAVLNGAPPGKPTVLVFQGNGDGTFALKSSFNASGILPLGLTAADMNGDGKVDLVSSGKAYPDSFDQLGDMAVHLGAGDGTFRLKQRFGTNEAHQIVTADVNNDGKVDVVGSYTLSDQVVLLVNEGDGQLFSTAKYPVGAFPVDAAAGDFNGDGFDDISVLNNNARSISILLNNQDGSFHPAGEMDLGGSGDSETLADFNSDGYPDIAATNGRGGVSVLLGNGDGTFQPAVPYTTGDPFVVLTGDFNSDGIVDLIADNFNGATISVLPGRGDGTFGPRINSPTSSGQPLGFAVGDLDGDGKLDAVLAYNFSDQIDVFRGNGDGTFSLFRSYHAGGNNLSIQIADLNADGKSDVVVGDNSAGEILIFDGNGDGTLRPPRRLKAKNNGANKVRVLDWDHDGILDLAVVGGDFSILHGRGNGSFGTEFDIGTFVFAALAAGDFLGLGGTDVALTNDFGTVTVLLNQPVIALTSKQLAFGNQQVGTQSQPLSVKISNPGTVPIAINAIIATSDFSQTSDCGASIAIQSSCTVKVVFTPTQIGKRTGTLRINDKVPGSPQVVLLSGTGI